MFLHVFDSKIFHRRDCLFTFYAFIRHCTSRSEKKSEKIMRVLNVAEKNDAAKNISDLMSNGRHRRRDGRSVFNKIYEFDYNLFNQRCSMVMTSVSGHLLNLEFVGSYRNWQACNPVSLFDAPVDMFCPRDFQNIKRTLEIEVQNCQHLVLWTDCDREGENIGFEILDVCVRANSNIQVHRAKFSEITKHAVTRAIQNLGPPDKRLSDAVNVRRELDLRIGASFTRFQTLRLQKVFPEILGHQLISYGSCQFPTLGFVTERYKQVQAFIPEPFWKIKVNHKKEDDVTEFSWKRGRLFDHSACVVLYQRCLEQPLAKVIDLKSKPKSKWRPQPLDTVELEKTASRKLRINAKEALNIAEKLYTKGYISYPRTETTIFPKELNLPSLVQMQCEDDNWGEFATRVLENGPNPRQGTKTDNAHPPIHPIKYANNLQGKDKTLYEYVVRHFLACLSKDAVGQETTVEIEINDEKFVATGLMIIERNYLDVYPYERWSSKVIAQYNIGEEFTPSSVEMTEGKTSAPELLTEADLIALMEKHGIGTDATHAEHIETIKSRNYVGLVNNKHFVPGELGMGLVEGYDMMGFEMSKPHLRAELEADLKRISDGSKNPAEVLQFQVAKYKEYFIEAVQQANKIDTALSNYFETAPGVFREERGGASLSSLMKCPKCNSGDIVIKIRKENKGFYLSCLAYPQCNAVIWLPELVEEVSITDNICDRCTPGPIKKLKFKVKRGSLLPFYGDEFIGCIGGCDSQILEVLNIRPLTSTSSIGNSIDSSGSIASRSRSIDSGFLIANSNDTIVRQASFRSSVSSETSAPSATRFRNQNGPRNSAPSSFPSSRSFGDTNSATNSYSIQSNERSHRNGGNMSIGHNSTSQIACNCGKPAVLLTVRKEGLNTGKKFYKCPNPKDQQCAFFLWEEDVVAQTNFNDNPPSSSHVYHNNNNNNNSSTSNNSRIFLGRDSSNVLCNCSSAAKLLTTQKEGPNKGRKFYVCPKPKDNQCKFFVWEDEMISNSGTSNSGAYGNSNASHSRSRQNGGNTMGSTKRKCRICGNEGHNKRKCPMAQDTRT